MGEDFFDSATNVLQVSKINHGYILTFVDSVMHKCWLRKKRFGELAGAIENESERSGYIVFNEKHLNNSCKQLSCKHYRYSLFREQFY